MHDLFPRRSREPADGKPLDQDGEKDDDIGDHQHLEAKQQEKDGITSTW